MQDGAMVRVLVSHQCVGTRWCHMWVKFVLGSRPCSECFSLVLRFSSLHKNQHLQIGSLHDPVTWYKIKHAGEQVAQWDFKTKAGALIWKSHCETPTYLTV